MIQQGDKVAIKNSSQLVNRGLGNLCGKTGIVKKTLVSNGFLVGAFVDVKILRKTKTYFIPTASLEGPDEINRKRVESLLKTTNI